jgi:hypothetical protein
LTVEGWPSIGRRQRLHLMNHILACHSPEGSTCVMLSAISAPPPRPRPEPGCALGQAPSSGGRGPGGGVLLQAENKSWPSVNGLIARGRMFHRMSEPGFSMNPVTVVQTQLAA